MRAAKEVYASKDFARETARWAPGIAADSARLMATLQSAAWHVPTVVVSAGSHRPSSVIRTAHQQLVALVGAEHRIWTDTTHALHLQRTDAVAAEAERLLKTQP
jgi:pimeloyl-ACP methyl ester carboxylesterase